MFLIQKDRHPKSQCHDCKRTFELSYYQRKRLESGKSVNCQCEACRLGWAEWNASVLADIRQACSAHRQRMHA